MPYTRNYYENAHVAPGTENSGRPLVYLPHSPYAATAYEADPYGNVSALTGYPSQYPHVIRREHIPYRRNLRVVEPGFTELIREAAARDMFAYLDREQQRPRSSGGGTTKSKGTGKPKAEAPKSFDFNYKAPAPLPEPHFVWQREPIIVPGGPTTDDNDDDGSVPPIFFSDGGKWGGRNDGKPGGRPTPAAPALPAPQPEARPLAAPQPDAVPLPAPQPAAKPLPKPGVQPLPAPQPEAEPERVPAPDITPLPKPKPKKAPAPQPEEEPERDPYKAPEQQPEKAPVRAPEPRVIPKPKIVRKPNTAPAPPADELPLAAYEGAPGYMGEYSFDYTTPEGVDLIDISGQGRDLYSDFKRAISDPRVQAMALAVPGTGLALNGGKLLWSAMQLLSRYPALARVMAGGM